MKSGRARPRGGRVIVTGLVAAVAVALVALVGAAGWGALAADHAVTALLLVTAAAVALAALVALSLRLVRLYDGLDRLRGDLIQLSQGRLAIGRGGPSARRDPDIAGTADLVADLSDLMTDRDRRTAMRLESVLAGVASAIVVATESGQVTLVNSAARRLLGADRVALGTSIYAALAAPSAIAAARRAREEGMAVFTDLPTVEDRALPARITILPDDGGTLYSFAADGDDGENGENGENGLDHALGLHDIAPPSAGYDNATPLADLPVFVLDLETTGLDVENDTVVAIGGLCAVGGRLYRGSTLDMLVNPNRPIPARAVRIHGITDAMVAAAPRFQEAWPALAAMIEGRVVVGHHIGFDAAVLRAATRRVDGDTPNWRPPVTLDTAQLAMALDPRGGAPSLEALAGHYGVDVVGRHTALGDALTAAAIWQRLIPRLADRDIVTLGAARAFANTARALLQKQKKAGWHIDGET